MATPILAVRPSDFYVYVHRRASDGTVFYVGKGRGRRATKTQQRTAFWQNIVNKHGFTVDYVAKDLSEEDAIKLEMETIAHYGRENLCNLTDGGEGMWGHVVSAEVRKRIGEAHRGAKRSLETIERMRKAQKGRIITEEAREKISAALKGRKLPPEVAEKMGKSRLGKKRPESVKAKLSAAWAACPDRRAERCKAMSAASTTGRRVRCAETGQVFERLTVAAEWLHKQGHTKARGSSIGVACSGKVATAYGYTWQYID